MVHLGNGWDKRLEAEFAKEYYQKLRSFLKQEYMASTVYPPMNDIYNALRYTDYDDVKAVNTENNPDEVKPVKGRNGKMDGGSMTVKLPALSWNVIRLAP